jgi:UDP-N-acetylmuramate dehydrogenase
MKGQASLQKLLPELECSFAEPMSKWTSVRVGGVADCVVRPSLGSVAGLMRWLRDEQHLLQILGGGANTLVGDLGIRGVCVKLKNEPLQERIVLNSEGALMELSAGAAITRLVTLMKQHALVGAEFLAGIPGTIGGALAMNAGTKHGECMRLVQSVELATADGLGWVSDLSAGYRKTQLPAGSLVTRVRFDLPFGDLDASKSAMDRDLTYRKSTQPLSQPNFGSVFTNPPGQFAGALIEGVSLKGHRIGEAQISPLHANWIVNLGQAKAKDILALMAVAQERVKNETGIELVPEVKRLGEFET